jgi:hypothetical protein
VNKISLFFHSGALFCFCLIFASTCHGPWSRGARRSRSLRRCATIISSPRPNGRRSGRERGHQWQNLPAQLRSISECFATDPRGQKPRCRQHPTAARRLWAPAAASRGAPFPARVETTLTVAGCRALVLRRIASTRRCGKPSAHPYVARRHSTMAGATTPCRIDRCTSGDQAAVVGQAASHRETPLASNARDPHQRSQLAIRVPPPCLI